MWIVLLCCREEEGTRKEWREEEGREREDDKGVRQLALVGGLLATSIRVSTPWLMAHY